ncbi:cysteine desulfurase [Clostridium bornimense]|uniref:Cysteine desulfurase n=1 Tax=Clostridium bornimense TaxID=1216932 RepID=W6SFQ8_9CLOT|nr:cysteine desulfurase family protein [Clostridium bornimense]CDM68520.1 cysteine desulfurase [Clostridium bornimense]
MIYLDYAANTPVDEEVLQVFCEASKAYLGNPNSSHKLGRDAKGAIDAATENISNLLNAKERDIIYTSSGTEANNLAIKGVAKAYRSYGKHIITTYLEHSSVTAAMVDLQNQGYEIDFVDVLSDGTIDLDHLEELIRKDTILVSICYVGSEVGIIQPIDQVSKVISKYENCFLHVDATQALGKMNIDMNNMDLVTFTAHKFYGLNGSGVVIKKKEIRMEPIIHGGTSTTIFRSGTPDVAMILATEKAIDIAISNLDERYNYVKCLNNILRKEFLKYKEVLINSSEKASPYILNISIKGIKANRIQDELEKNGIYIATKAACCATNTVSKPVFAITKDRKRAMGAIRISLSHLVSEEDIKVFLEKFKKCYEKLINE